MVIRFAAPCIKEACGRRLHHLVLPVDGSKSNMQKLKKDEEEEVGSRMYCQNWVPDWYYENFIPVATRGTAAENSQCGPKCIFPTDCNIKINAL